MKEAQLSKVIVLGHENEAVLSRMFPDLSVGTAMQSNVVDMPAFRKSLRQLR